MTDLSYQLYCSRNFPPLTETCRMLGDIGYTQVEGYGGLFDDVDGLKSALNLGGLEMTSSHMGLDLVEGDPARAIAIARDLGIKKIFVPHLMPDQRPQDDAGWVAFGARLVEAGKPFLDAGLIYGWHNHDFEFKPTSSGKMPMDLMAENDFAIELDLGWVARAGLNPVAWIKHFAGRIAAAHVKDIAPTGTCEDEDGWADVGHGTMDWPAIHAACQAAGVTHYVAEHDNPNDHNRFATRTLAALRSL